MQLKRSFISRNRQEIDYRNQKNLVSFFFFSVRPTGLACCLVAALDAHLTTTDTCLEVARLQGRSLRDRPLVLGVNGRQPEGQGVSKVVTGASLSTAFNERSTAELFQT